MRGSLKIQDAKNRQKSQSGHHPTTLSGYIFATKAYIDNREKNLLSSRISSTCPHNMVNFGPAAEISSLVWCIPANVNGFRVLTALLHGTLVVGVSQALRRWTEGITYIWQGGHHVGHWPTFLVNIDMWPANNPDLIPVDYHILWCCLSENSSCYTT